MAMGFVVTRFVIVCSLMLGVLFAPVAATKGQCAKAVVCVKKCCESKACCAANNKDAEPTQQVPFQKADVKVAEAVLSVPVCVFVFPEPVEARFAAQPDVQRGHSPEPLAVSCIRLI